MAETDGKEKQLRAYLFAAPHPWLALSAEYLYEDFERNADLSLTYQEVKTHRLPLSARFFHPSGFERFRRRHVP